MLLIPHFLGERSTYAECNFGRLLGKSSSARIRERALREKIPSPWNSARPRLRSPAAWADRAAAEPKRQFIRGPPWPAINIL